MSSGKTYLKEAFNAILQNDFQRAIDSFNKAIECEPDNPSYYYKLSITYSRNGDIKEALKAAEIAHRLQPKAQTYLYHMQILQAKNMVLQSAKSIETGDLSEENETMLIQAKKLDPLNIDAYLLLGIYYGEKGLLNLALKEFNLVLNLEPFHQKARHLKEYYINLYQEGGKNG